MNDTGVTSSDMLLNNLVDHQVIRIEGSQGWMKQVSDRIIVSHEDCLVLNGELILSTVQERLSAYLNVENDASFIQQELKGWLVKGKRLLIIVDSHSVGANALTYLMGLPSICDENGTAVSIILVTSPELIKALKSSPALAAKLDGYYQEDKETNPVAVGQSYKALTSAAVVVCLGIGGYFLYSSTTDKSQPAEQDALVDNSSVVSLDETTQQPSSSVVDNEPATSMNDDAATKVDVPHESDKVVIKLVDSNGDGEADSIKKSVVKLVKEKAASTTDRQLLTEFSTAIESAKAELVPSTENVRGDAPSSNVGKTGVAAVHHIQKSEPVTGSAQTKEKTAEPKDEPGPVIDNPQEPVVKLVVDIPETTETNNHIAAVVSVAPKKYTTAKAIAAINNEAAVSQVVEQWGKAWGSQDWNGYINSYLQNTKLYGVKMSLEEWRAFRKKRLMTPEWIKLELGDVKYTRLNSHWYRAEFYQRFEKPGYADETTKRLELTLTSNGWKIASEAAEGTVVLKRPGGV